MDIYRASSRNGNRAGPEAFSPYNLRQEQFVFGKDFSTEKSYSVEKYCYDPKAEPHVEVSLLDCLPPKVVLEKVWPTLMSGEDALQNFRMCTEMRLICRS
ncbi:hypothetical protein M758_UG204300 [Ceratodon purpureus]|nr:hypothetical protein M758_UG204300 [Ceratodon purpureus]